MKILKNENPQKYRFTNPGAAYASDVTIFIHQI
jgi:hypothetical protein